MPILSIKLYHREADRLFFLILSGGGARGAYQVGVIKYLVSTLFNPRKYSPPGDMRKIRAVLESYIDISALSNSGTRILISALN